MGIYSVVSLFLCGMLCCTAPLAWAGEDSAQQPEVLAEAGGGEVRELWSGKLYTSTYRAGVCLPAEGDGPVRGVLLLRLSSGQVDVYHFDGRTEGGVISLRHISGHKFEGRLDSADVVSGKIRLKNGFTVNMKGQRTHNAELSAGKCRPLPE